MQSSHTYFIVSFLFLYVFYNTCRRLLVVTGPYYFSHNMLDYETYGLISSVTSVIFGICRFIAYTLVEWFPLDKYITFCTIAASCICILLTITSSQSFGLSPSTFLFICFIILFICIGLPFPSSSVVARQFVPESHLSFVWSLFAISSCVGSIVASTLAYYFDNPSSLFTVVARFGFAAAICVFVLFPTEDDKTTKVKTEQQDDKKDNTKNTDNNDKKETSLSKSRELICLILSLLSHFCVYYCRRIIAEWSSVYIQPLFHVNDTVANQMFTFGYDLFEIASVASLLLFGIVTSWFPSISIAVILFLCTTLACLSIFLQVIGSMYNSQFLYYISTFLTGFFLSIPHASTELLLLKLSHHFNVNRVLSIAALNSQLAATLSGYPTDLIFSKFVGYKNAPLYQMGVLVISLICGLCVCYLSKDMKKKEKVE